MNRYSIKKLLYFDRIEVGDRMEKRLENKKILITGATGGIGEKLALHIANEGAIPILIGRNEHKLLALKEKITSNYPIEPLCFTGDLTDKRFISFLIQEIQEADVLINNAGIGLFEKLENTSDKAIEEMLYLNIHALVYLTKNLLPSIKNNNGHIVQIASMAGKIPTPKSSIYAASKAFVINFSNAIRMECKDSNVKVTTVNLGPVRTGFFDHADQTGNYRKNVDRYMLDPDKVATKITRALYTRKREINLPFWMQLGSYFYYLIPHMMERLLEPTFRKK